jgi:hypothetical protein
MHYACTRIFTDFSQMNEIMHHRTVYETYGWSGFADGDDEGFDADFDKLVNSAVSVLFCYLCFIFI